MEKNVLKMTAREMLETLPGFYPPDYPEMDWKSGPYAMLRFDRCVREVEITTLTAPIYDDGTIMSVQDEKLELHSVPDILAAMPNWPGYLDLDKTRLVSVELDLDDFGEPRLHADIMPAVSAPTTRRDWVNLINAKFSAYRDRITVVTHNDAKAESVESFAGYMDLGEDRHLDNVAKLRRFLTDEEYVPFLIQVVSGSNDENQSLMVVHVVDDNPVLTTDTPTTGGGAPADRISE